MIYMTFMDDSKPRADHTYFSTIQEHLLTHIICWIIKQTFTNLKELKSYRIYFLTIKESNKKSPEKDNRKNLQISGN